MVYCMHILNFDFNQACLTRSSDRKFIGNTPLESCKTWLQDNFGLTNYEKRLLLIYYIQTVNMRTKTSQSQYNQFTMAIIWQKQNHFFSRILFFSFGISWIEFRVLFDHKLNIFEILIFKISNSINHYLFFQINQVFN